MRHNNVIRTKPATVNGRSRLFSGWIAANKRLQTFYEPLKKKNRPESETATNERKPKKTVQHKEILMNGRVHSSIIMFLSIISHWKIIQLFIYVQSVWSEHKQQKKTKNIFLLLPITAACLSLLQMTIVRVHSDLLMRVVALRHKMKSHDESGSQINLGPTKTNTPVFLLSDFICRS